MDTVTSIFFEDQETQERYLRTHGTVKPKDISNNSIAAGDMVRLVTTGEITEVIETDFLDGSIRLILKPNPMSFWFNSNEFILEQRKETSICNQEYSTEYFPVAIDQFLGTPSFMLIQELERRNEVTKGLQVKIVVVVEGGCLSSVLTQNAHDNISLSLIDYDNFDDENPPSKRDKTLIADLHNYKEVYF